MDSLYFLLKDNKMPFSKYFEIDFPEITGTKVMAVCKKLASTHLQNRTLVGGGTELNSDDYAIVSGDLRQWSFHLVDKLVSTFAFSKDQPTIFISECCLVYLPIEHSNAILSWISSSMHTAYVVMYEQTNMQDAFGQTMVSNLKLRNIQLETTSEYPTLDSQIERFNQQPLNYTHTIAITLYEYYDTFVSAEDKKRLHQIEWLDELEEFNLFMDHYFVLVAFSSRDSSVQSVFTLADIFA